MKYIEKDPEEPASFSRWKALKTDKIKERIAEGSPTKLWKFFRGAYPIDKEGQKWAEDGSDRPFHQFRQYLLKEQGYICAYCLQEIVLDNTTLEHVQAKENDIDLTLDYYNIVACCQGVDTEEKDRHCGNKKQLKKIALTPLMPNCETDIFFNIDGTIHGINKPARKTIRVLGLDCNRLKSLREAAIESFLYMDTDQTILIDSGTAMTLIEELKKRRKNAYIPFCTAIINALQRDVLGN